MAKTKIGSNAIFSGPQKGLSIYGEHCSAMSGVVSVDDTETTLLDFTTGKGYIVAVFDMVRMETAAITDDYVYTIKFNGNAVYRTQTTSAYSRRTDLEGIDMLIPALTRVIVTADNITNSDSNDIGAIVTGRVYR